KNENRHWKMSGCLATAALTLLLISPGARAAAPALNASVTLRPLTHTEIEDYGLTNAQFSGGLNTVGLGEPVYLDAMVNAAIASSNLVTVTWSLTTPSGSASAFLPVILGPNVPIYNTADRISGENSTPVYQLAGRAFFRPDVVGQYTVTATIGARGSGTNTVSIRVTGATYLGVQTCAACHSGAFANVPNMYQTFTNTLHASYFKRAINGQLSSHYNSSCIQCHTTGYDTNSFAVNNGFDDIAKLYGWTFPTVLTNGNWEAMPSDLQNVANINCENCHGPGSQHMFSDGVTGNTNAISVNYFAGDCSQCHDELPNHHYSAEWNNSLHARSARQTSPACVRCHTGPGFIGWATAGGMAAQNQYPTNVICANSFSTNILTTAPNTMYAAVDCQACHDPHDASNPHQLRMGYNVVLSDGTAVTNAGAGGLCMQCHNSRNGSVTNMMAKYPLNQANWAGGVGFGPHDSPQGDMLEGVNAITYGRVIPNSPHANVVSNTCVGCHMQNIPSTDPAFTLAGSHTFKMDYTDTNGAEVDVTYACQQCHGNIQTFNFPVADYNGDGVIEGVQTEVQHLLDKLSTLLPPAGYHANANDYVADGLVKTINYKWGATNMPAKFLNAAYNYEFVSADGSLGVHNAAYAVGLLKASIADLTGDANEDGIPDSWQIQYFGSVTNPLAAPNAVNNDAGVPNWMMYAMGLDPRGGVTVGNSGVIYFDGGNIVNGATNTVAIYTAAEIAFDTQAGVNYQIQGISSLSGGWQNISTNIPGTGGSVSYLTPTRNNAQMFFRVVQTP
ncbi:MAG TPA: cytochrome c3 family protein, partial [Verrucomicrobiae bacterium]|nr:cytochrome c3 family protein [Verrucomicrobiae bacterium]